MDISSAFSNSQFYPYDVNYWDSLSRLTIHSVEHAWILPRRVSSLAERMPAPAGLKLSENFPCFFSGLLRVHI